MSADNMICLQRCPDGKWRAWEGFASDDSHPRPAKCAVEEDTREAAIVKAFDYSREHWTEYGVVELDPDDGPQGPMPTIREDFDLMADAHMAVFGMKNSPARERVWKALEKALQENTTL